MKYKLSTPTRVLVLTYSGIDWQLRRSRCNRLHDLRRQAEAHIFRHYLDLIDIAIALGLQILDNVFHQYLRSRRAGGHSDGIYPVKPLRLNSIRSINQV